MTQQSI